jgi:hypothetical protein
MGNLVQGIKKKITLQSFICHTAERNLKGMPLDGRFGMVYAKLL